MINIWAGTRKLIALVVVVSKKRLKDFIIYIIKWKI